MTTMFLPRSAGAEAETASDGATKRQQRAVVECGSSSESGESVHSEHYSIVCLLFYDRLLCSP